MPQASTIIDDRYYNSLRNGLDFSLNTSEYAANLTGSVGESCRRTIDLEIEWWSIASFTSPWVIASTTIRRGSGSFYSDGWRVGHTFDQITEKANSPTVAFTGIITDISESGSIITFSVSAGAVATGDFTQAVIWARADAQDNYLTALVYRFGLIDNNDPVSFNSGVSNNDQRYYANGIGDDLVRPTTPVTMTVKGQIMDWVTGNVSVQFLTNDTYHQVFRVTHDFIITPFYLEGEATNLQTGLSPDRLKGVNTLKHVFETDFRFDLTDPNTAIIAQQDSVLGSVGWFNENNNGFTSDYALLSVAYEDTASGAPVNALQVSKRTTVDIIIQRNSGVFVATDSSLAVVSFLPSQDQYTNTLTDLETNFLYDSVRSIDGQPAATSDIIKSAITGVVGGVMVIQLEIEYTASQALIVSEQDYLISVQVEDSTLSAQQSDRVMLLIDTDTYSAVDVISNLATFTAFKFVDHPQIAQTGIFESTLNVWNNDGIVVEFFFDLDYSNQAIANNITLQLVAFNTVTGEDFTLDSYRFNLSGIVTTGGIQQITIDDTRGYVLAENDQFNWARIETGTNNGTIQSYIGAIGQKISWEDWIRNLNADSIFFDGAKPNSNLNFKASNYSNLNDYEIRVKGVINVTGINDLNQPVTGDSIGFSDELTVSDYAEDQNNNPVKWTTVIETFDNVTMANLGGNILGGGSTLIKCTHVNSDGPVLVLGSIWSITKMEIFQDISKSINELSSIVTAPTPNYLVPILGETKLKVYLDSGNVITECLINFAALPAGITKYSFYSRIGK